MKDALIKKKRAKVNHKIRILLIGLFLVVLAEPGVSVRAAEISGNGSNLRSSNSISCFDPFALIRRIYTEPKQPAPLNPSLLGIRIPTRPSLRSPYRPPLEFSQGLSSGNM